MPRHIYKTSKGRVPGVTTVLKEWGVGKEALAFWANKMGLDGIEMSEARNKAANLGTVVHAAIEADIKGLPFNFDELPLTDEDRAKGKDKFESWREWRISSRLEMIGAEVTVISEKYQYGGTLDAASLYSKRGIFDLKTGNAVYPEAVVQVAAYSGAWEENFPDQPIEEHHILRVGEDGSFHHHRYGRLDDARELFYTLLKVYELGKKIKKLV
jgi:hypothetical protein